MNKITTIFLLALCIITACKNSSVKTHNSSVKIDSTQIYFNKSFMEIKKGELPFSSNKLKKYIVFDTVEFPYNPNYLKTAIKHNLLKRSFNDKIISDKKRIAFKTMENGNYDKGNYFYPVYAFSNTAKMILFLYQDFEDIMPAVVSQLNLYHENGKFLDSLILDKKFHFEISYSNQFTMNEDEIEIIKKTTNYYDNNDDLLDKSIKPRITFDTIYYTIKPNIGFIKKEK